MPVQQQPRRAAEPALESLARLPSESVEPAVAVQVSLRTDPPCVHSSPRARKTVTALDPGQAVRKVLKEEAHESMERWSIVHDREPGRLSTASFPSVTGRYSNLSTLHASDGSGTGARRRSKQDGTRNYEVTMLTAWQFFKELHEVVLETGDLRDYICHTYGVRRRQESGLSCAKRSRGVCKQRRHGRVLTPACERVDYTLSGASLPTSTTSSVRCTASLASSSVSTTAMAAPTRATPASVSTNSYQMDPRRPEGRSIAPAGLGHAVRREERALVDMLLARTFSQIDETEGLDTEGSFAASPSSSDFSDSLCFLDAVLDALVEDSSEEVYVS
ncbi:conserved hypothetical protein [Neospora caninum Liverpool]|uniref:Uncharacterized protein n=1 Tax=Neospora caninum (strain Liverpool) TaxID=572307 RepID=F0VD19_NEOCL|nr:conserved hypothetical protein [Neospora caninum Liverpool]CBZ51534.1 conserved hypothetical protein [Neospora caninum Liverpool]CEL65484.1 TPA: hypothetical protein BN1204_013270 [Neospora caninum Liverpool]|eukprot:XP_003881567.1 conserved hypothetical protein [Neospora caninum Liverpool]